jgi:hypothetical protein
MTDFFAELEGHLHDAARRRARRSWLPAPAPRIVFAVVTAAATLAIVFAGLSLIGDGRDPEVAVPPAPTPAGPAPERVDCRNEAIPAILPASFEVLRREPTDGDRIPEEIEQTITRHMRGLAVAKAWTLDARRVQLEHATYWVVPALVGELCDDRPDPVRDAGVCVVFVHEAARASCLSLAAVRVGKLAFGGRTGDGRLFKAALVPDGFTMHVEVAGRRENGVVSDNIGEKAYVATGAEDETARVFLEPLEDGAPPPAPGCFSVTEDEPDPRTREILTMFAQPEPGDTYEGAWSAGVLDTAERKAVGVHLDYGRLVGKAAGFEVLAVPVQRVLAEGASCRDAGGEPGVCAVAKSGDGAATERQAWCWTLDEVTRGDAAAFVAVGKERRLRIGVVASAGATGTGDPGLQRFCEDNPGACDHNFEIRLEP